MTTVGVGVTLGVLATVGVVWTTGVIVSSADINTKGYVSIRIAMKMLILRTI